jgi:hypothetical protein
VACFDCSVRFDGAGGLRHGAIAAEGCDHDGNGYGYGYGKRFRVGRDEYGNGNRAGNDFWRGADEPGAFTYRNAATESDSAYADSDADADADAYPDADSYADAYAYADSYAYAYAYADADAYDRFGGELWGFDYVWVPGDTAEWVG